MTDTKRDELLIQISSDLGEIKAKLYADYRALYGNGHAGLIEKHNDLDKRVIAVEDQHRHEAKSKSAWVAWIAIIISAASAALSWLKNS